MSREASIRLDSRYYGVCGSVSGDRLRDRARCPARRSNGERVCDIESVDRVNLGYLREFWREFRSHRACEKCYCACREGDRLNDCGLKFVNVCGGVMRACELQFVVRIN